MKILQINSFHFPKGGSDKVYLNTARLLKNRGHIVVCFSSNNNRNIKEFSNKYFVSNSIPTNKNFVSQLLSLRDFLYSKEAYKNLKSLIAAEKPDIAHLHIFYGYLTSSVLAALNELKVPTVMSVHEYKMLCPAYTFLNGKDEICEKCPNSKSYWYCITGKCTKNNYIYSTVAALESAYRDKYFNYFDRIDKFIMPSKFILDTHVKYHPEIIDKVELVYNCQLAGFNYELNLESINGDYYLYLGRLSKEKGVLTLLNAWKYFRNIKLKVVGEGPEKEYLENYVKTNDINSVEFTGYQSGKALQKLVKNCSFVIIPSEWYENNPMSVIESLSLGKPVIGADIGGIPEILDESFAFIFESGNIESLKNSIKKSLAVKGSKYFSYANSAKQFARETFSEDIHYEKLINIYNSVLNTNETSS